ncbi:putative fungal specific transcription factor [Cladophialophora carrionii]|uniref:Putative fungal specific transcription factor n=1 Tax=Cladophialophora carrionii TaxID=86049 RepID=A0A1C1C8K6_9EURO|nr:putative fungal specific transcription factor [Cladophialophora carrionii]
MDQDKKGIPHQRKRPRYLSTGGGPETPTSTPQTADYVTLTSEEAVSPAPREPQRGEASTRIFQNAAEIGSLGQFSFNLRSEPADTQRASDGFVGDAQDAAPQSPVYVVATVESHVGQSDYIGAGEVRFREEMGQAQSPASGLSDTDLRLLQVQKAFDLPQRSVLASLIDCYFEYCSGWVPILEPAAVEEVQSTGSSPLLLNALLLAGSRVTSNDLLAALAEDFYRKARLLFILGHERDALNSIIAVTLLQWYNPTGPERISTSTSGFWVRISAGLAYQTGLHKEPVAAKDRGLRRRLWWAIVARDDIISVGTGRPRTINLDDSDVAPPTIHDFPASDGKARLFVVFSGIIRLLGDLTENIRRKTVTATKRANLENALYRWVKDLAPSFRLFHPSSQKLNPYSFEARQLLVPYFVTLFILARHSPGQDKTLRVSFIASSFVVGIFEDFLNRGELCHCGPVFSFYAFAAGLAQMPALRYRTLAQSATESFSIIQSSLAELMKRWGSAEGALAVLVEMNKLTLQRPTLGDAPSQGSTDFAPFFDDFGPELCRHYWLLERPGQIVNAPPSLPSCFGQADVSEPRLDREMDDSVDRLRPQTSVDPSVLNTEHADPMLMSQNPIFFDDLDPSGRWIDDLGLGLATY